MTHVPHVNCWEPVVYISHMSGSFRLFLASNLSVLNFRIFLLMYPGQCVLPDFPPLKMAHFSDPLQGTGVKVATPLHVPTQIMLA